MAWHLMLQTDDPQETHALTAFLKKNGIADRYIKHVSTYSDHIANMTKEGYCEKEIARRLENIWGFEIYVSSHIQSRKRSRLSNDWWDLYQRKKYIKP
jgi:hypothetical protein